MPEIDIPLVRTYEYQHMHVGASRDGWNTRWTGEKTFGSVKANAASFPEMGDGYRGLYASPGSDGISDTCGSRSTQRTIKKKATRLSRSCDSAITSLKHYAGTASPKKGATKVESSPHFGVRYRPDLSKWVAEIRVAEWKLVDKKVWLGTFDTEEGAARAVDAARKLLKCSKKRHFNFPCEQLDAYSEAIPAHLDLKELLNETMFKDVTAFVKKKSKEYAAAFCPNQGICRAISGQMDHNHKEGLQAVLNGFPLLDETELQFEPTSCKSQEPFDEASTLSLMDYHEEKPILTSITLCPADSDRPTMWDQFPDVAVAANSPTEHRQWLLDEEMGLSIETSDYAVDYNDHRLLPTGPTGHHLSRNTWLYSTPSNEEMRDTIMDPSQSTNLEISSQYASSFSDEQQVDDNNMIGDDATNFWMDQLMDFQGGTSTSNSWPLDDELSSIMGTSSSHDSCHELLGFETKCPPGSNLLQFPSSDSGLTTHLHESMSNLFSFDWLLHGN